MKALDWQQLHSYRFLDHDLRVCVSSAGALLVASDVAKCLGYRDSESCTRHLPDDEVAWVVIPGRGGMQKQRAISEAGLYRLTLRSKKEAAERFRKFVLEQVLPAADRVLAAAGAVPEHVQKPLLDLVQAIDAHARENHHRQLALAQFNAETAVQKFHDLADLGRVFQRITVLLTVEEAAWALNVETSWFVAWLRQHRLHNGSVWRRDWVSKGLASDGAEPMLAVQGIEAIVRKLRRDGLR